MSNQVTFLDALVEAIHRAANYNENDQVPPIAILWTDKDRQWEALQPLLRGYLPLFTLGEYKPEEQTGPAYWLRCVIARTLPDHPLPPNVIPVIYLPGISKQEIRAIEDTPKILQPLAELQYRGVLWTHKSGRDWTVTSFIQSANGGLGLEINTDTATKAALQRALPKLADEPIARLKKEAPLRATFFDALLHPDEVRNLLLWLNDSVGYPKRCSNAEWASFCDLCKRKYDFHPFQDGIVTAIVHFGQQQGVWEPVWNRFKDAPHAYPHIPELLRSARPTQPSLFANVEAWPQDNEAAEFALRESLFILRNKLPNEIRTSLHELEQAHGIRRSWVWTILGQSPLAAALLYLEALAKETEQPLEGTTVSEIVTAYIERGWKADLAAIRALATLENADTQDIAAVKPVINALYRPWLEKAAITIQKAVITGHPSQTYSVEHLETPANGTCILFSDGLRYDIGQHLVTTLEDSKLTCNVRSHLAALPTITPTAKPAISPIANLISGKNSPGLELVVTTSGTKVTAEALRKLLDQGGYQVLKSDDLGDPSGKAWTEIGAIDSIGHSDGWKLAYRLKNEIDTIKRRIEALLNWGWKQVVVITDHGWLLLPGGLPKAELPEHLTYMRKGRCAQLKELSNTDQQTIPWYWNHDIYIALAPSIHCYEAGKEYDHGGLSPQECIVPIITVAKQGIVSQPITLENVTWRGLRCTMNITGTLQDTKIDIRSKASDPTTSLLSSPKCPNADGSVSVLIEDEDRKGEAALIVVLDSNGVVSKQTLVTVGG